MPLCWHLLCHLTVYLSLFMPYTGQFGWAILCATKVLVYMSETSTSPSGVSVKPKVCILTLNFLFWPPKVHFDPKFFILTLKSVHFDPKFSVLTPRCAVWPPILYWHLKVHFDAKFSILTPKFIKLTFLFLLRSLITLILKILGKTLAHSLLVFGKVF